MRSGSYGEWFRMEMDIELKRYLAPVSESLAEFEVAFRESIAGNSGLQGAIADHLIAGRGKRMRPALVLLSHRSQVPNGPAAIPAAVAIELIHTATLLHDDVIDVSDRRRGQLSVNARWNNLAAVLMGDHLFARAFGVLVELRNHRLLEAVSSATKRVAVGELLQLQQNRNFDLTEAEYIRVISDKTASLFGAACQAGVLEAAPDSDDASKYQEFGEMLGMSFQIVDDLLDYIGDSEKTGKERGNDIKEGKITLPLIQALKSADSASRREILETIKNYTPNDFDAVRDFISRNGGFDYAQRKAVQLKDNALEFLGRLAASPYRQSLESIVDYSVSRNV